MSKGLSFSNHLLLFGDRSPRPGTSATTRRVRQDEPVVKVCDFGVAKLHLGVGRGGGR